MNDNKEEDLREDFCPSCVMIPLAMAGVGVGVAGARKPGDHKKERKKKMIMSVVLTIISVLVIIYFVYARKKCEGCR